MKSRLSLLVLSLGLASSALSHDWKGTFQKDLLDPRYRLALGAKLGAEVGMPRNFAPRQGQVWLIDSTGSNLLQVRGEKVERVLPLRGTSFDPRKANLVDLLLLDEERALVLDQTQGTLWPVNLDTGRVGESFGLFVHPVEVAQGADGRVYVRDPGNASVAAFRDQRFETSYQSQEDLSPHASKAGKLPFLDFSTRPGRCLLKSLEVEGPDPRTATTREEFVAELKPYPGEVLLTAKILGLRDGSWVIQVLSHRPGDPGPRHQELWAVDPEAPQALRKVSVPSFLNQCMDCGPDWKVDGRGEVWGAVHRDSASRFLRLARRGWMPW